VLKYTAIRYDTIEEFNVDSKAQCDQLNLAHVARKNIKKKKLKQTNASAHLVKAVQKRPGRLWRKGFVKEMSYETSRLPYGITQCNLTPVQYFTNILR